MSLNNNSDYEEIRSLRVRYSTIINYLYIIYRVLTASLFAVIVLRKLSVEDYGLFNVILALIALFQPIPQIWNMWVSRFYARKRYDIAYTGYSITLLYSVFSSLLLVVLMLIVLPLNKLTHETLFFSSLIVLSQVIYSTHVAILTNKKPYIVGYIDILGETLRVSLVYFFVVVLRMGLEGVLLGIAMAVLIKTIVSFIYMLYIKALSKPSLSFKNIALFLKNSYIPLINIVSSQLRNSGERLITSLVTNSMIYPAYLGVSYIPRSFIRGGAQAFSRGLGPRLLRGGSRTDIEDVMKIISIISLLFSGSFIIYAKVVLSMFRREYLDVYPLFILYSIAFILDVYILFFSMVSTSLERADLKYSGLSLRKTVLFKVPLIRFLANITYLSIASASFIILYYTGINDPISLLASYPILLIIVNIPVLYKLYTMAKKQIDFSIPWREIAASLCGLFIIYLYSLITGYINYMVKSIYSDLPMVTWIAISSLVIYVIVLYVLSPWFRELVRTSLEELKRIIRF